MGGIFMKHVILLFVSLISWSAWGAAPIHGYTPEQSQFMAKENQKTAANEFMRGLLTPWQGQMASVNVDRVPFAEYDQVGYIIFNDGSDFNALEIKKSIAKNLPEGVTLVIYTGNTDKNYQNRIFTLFTKDLPADRVKVVYLPDGESGFWARDGVPVPSWTLDVSGSKVFTVVDAKYYYPFEPDQTVSEMFSAELVSHDYYHEGGNFLANSLGECFVVDNERAVKVPDAVFLEKYGCQKTIRFPHIKGIGHIDESVKLINDRLALTDDASYAKILRDNGLTVNMLPRPQNQYETYVNSLYVNGTLFLPVFSQAGDADAIQLYESFGYKVIPLNSSSLSNDGLGSIHCITMAYPPVEFKVLLSQTGGTEVTPK